MSASGSAAAAVAIEDAMRVALSSVTATEYDGVGAQIIFDITLPGDDRTTGWFSGAVGWNGINSSAGTVDELVFADAISLTGSPVTAGTFPVSITATEVGGGLAAYYSNTGAVFTGTSGTITLSGGSFDGSATDCSGGRATVTCTFATGTLSGGFNFTAVRDGAEGNTRSHRSPTPACRPCG